MLCAIHTKLTYCASESVFACASSHKVQRCIPELRRIIRLRTMQTLTHSMVWPMYIVAFVSIPIKYQDSLLTGSYTHRSKLTHCIYCASKSFIARASSHKLQGGNHANTHSLHGTA